MSDRTAVAIERLANAITPFNTLPTEMPDGGSVGSLTEAMISIGHSLCRIADVLEDESNKGKLGDGP